jgi:hypothetical protein
MDFPLGAETAETVEEAGAVEAAEVAENFFNKVDFNIIEWPAFH